MQTTMMRTNISYGPGVIGMVGDTRHLDMIIFHFFCKNLNFIINFSLFETPYIIGDGFKPGKVRKYVYK